MFTAILLDILGPILLMVLLGALIRARFAIDVATLSKLNLYLFVPAFIFEKVSTSTLPWASMGGIVLVTLSQVFLLGVVVWMVGRAMGVEHKTLAAVAMAVMLYNSGNFGLPLAQLAYPGEDGKNGAAAQAFVLMTQNVLTFTLGLSIAAWAGSGSLLRGLGRVVRMPVLPTLAAALLARWWLDADPSHRLPLTISKTAQYLAGALVPVALVTLGAQLAGTRRWPRWRPVLSVVALRLIYAPIQMLALLLCLRWLGWPVMNLWPWPAEVLILTAAVPTAINTLLVTLELGGDADLAADTVFWTTVFSLLTLPVWLVVLRTMFGG